MTNREILAKNDMIATTYYNVASTIEQEGELTDAIRYYRRSLDLNPNHVMAMNNLAIAYFKLGDLASAQSLLENALKIDANLPEVHNNIGLIAAAQGDYQSAGDHFRKVIQLNPAYSPSVYYNLSLHIRLVI